MTLPAFAAERRAEALLLLLSAGAAVDRYKFPPAERSTAKLIAPHAGAAVE